MKKCCLFVFIFILGMSCSKPKDIEFRKLENLKVISMTTDNVTLTGDIICYNPNAISGKVKSTDLDVIVNRVKVGKALQEVATEIPAKSEFRIPAKVSFPPRKVLESDGGLLSGILNSVLNKKVKVDFKGTVTIDLLGVPIPVDIEHSEEISLR